MDSKPTIVLADDNQAMLNEVSRLLDRRFEISACVSNGAEAVQAVADTRPDVVILDVSMPVMGGFEAARRIRRMGLATRIVFFSVLRDEDFLNAAAQLGAPYVLKSQMRSDLVPAIMEALSSP